MDDFHEANAAAIPDAALVDQNIDDLFGEAADGLAIDALAAALPPIPPPAATALRMIEKQTKGCCTKLAWSPSGSIAQIANDSRHIVFRTLIRNTVSTGWYLSDPAPSPIVAPEGGWFEHIQFSRHGVDLAAVDNVGNVRIYTLLATLSRMHLAPSNISQNEIGRGDLDCVVALHWLPMSPGESKFPYISPASKNGDKWVTHLLSPSSGEASLHHPADKRSALFYVSRNAKLTLMYQIEAHWHATSSELEIPNSSAEQLSHAAMIEHGDQLLLVTHDSARRFRLYKITVNWNQIQNTRPAGPPYISVNPFLQVARLTVLEHIGAQQADLAVLSDLRLIAPIPANLAQLEAVNLPTVLAVFTRVCPSGDPTQQHADSFSILSRWNIEEGPATVDDVFKKLASSNNNPSYSPITVLRRLEDHITNKIVLSVESQHRNTILAFCTSDASVEFRDRTSMATLEPFGDSIAVSSLAQAGFEHMASEHIGHMAMTPSGSMVVIQSANGQMECRAMSLRYGWHALEDGLTGTRGLAEAAVVCLAREYTTLTCYQSSNDDILGCLPPDIDDDLRGLFIQSIIEMQGRSLDLALADSSRQNMHAIKETLLRSALSAQYVINLKRGTAKSNWSARFAYAFLNARTVCTVMAQSVSRPDTIVPPSLLHGLRGLARWGCDFLIYVADTLVVLRRKSLLASKGDPQVPTHDQFVKAGIDLESPVINLLLSTFTRTLFRFTGVMVRQYLVSVQKAIPHSRNVNERSQLENTLATLSKLPFKLTVVDALATRIDEAVRLAYKSSDVSSDRRSEIELSLMTDPNVPAELQPALTKILDADLPTFLQSVDLTELYFRDTSWLGIEPHSREQMRETDVVRKLPIPKGARLRICRRCGAVTEDPSPEAIREMSPILQHALRQCVCGNYWILEKGKDGEE